jgi:flagellin
LTASFISLSTPDKANAAIGLIDKALTKVNKQRADLGAYQNRLTYASKSLLTGYENMQAAESRIRDTDMANEMSDFTKNQILLNASISMLAQANARPQAILALLRG